MGRKSKSKGNRKRERPTQRPDKSASRSHALRRFALAAWFSLSCLLAAGGAYSLFSQPLRVKLGATLRTFDRVEFSYGGATKEHISPMCGCWNELEAEDWRGIAFAARRLTISRNGPTPLTAYVITTPWPAEIFAGGPWLGLPTKPFGPVPSSFDPAAVLEQFKAQALPDGASNIRTTVQYAVLVTDQPLHIRQFGETPFGAWIPMGASTVEIRPKLALFSSSANIVDVKEAYKAIQTGTPRQPRTLDTIYSKDLGDKDSNAEVPALDLLGKRTVLWTEGPSASVWLSEHSSKSSLRVSEAESAVGLVIDPAFSARIAVIPTNREALAHFAELEETQLLPQPQDWLSVSEAGSVSLRLERTADELREFDQITERLKVHDTIENVPVQYPQAMQLAADGREAFMYNEKTLRFRYPPAPPARGFNVFGAMRHLEFEGAAGVVVVGSKVVDVAASSALEFRDIEGFKAARGLIPIAVGGGAESLGTTLAFSGVSEAWLNGEPLSQLSDRFSNSTGFLAMIGGIVQAIAAVFGMAATVFTKRSDEQTPALL